MKVVYSGQHLRGNVILTLTGTKNVRSVYIDLCGKSYASWTDGHGRYQKTYTNEEVHLNKRTYFVGGHDGNAAVG